MKKPIATFAIGRKTLVYETIRMINSFKSTIRG